jgi:hypothetical protein
MILRKYIEKNTDLFSRAVDKQILHTERRFSKLRCKVTTSTRVACPLPHEN